MIEFAMTLIFAPLFSAGVLGINTLNENPLRLTKRGIYVLAFLAFLLGAGIIQFAINFNVGCNATTCFIHWGNPLNQ
jgi:uncharacterized membrane protein